MMIAWKSELLEEKTESPSRLGGKTEGKGAWEEEQEKRRLGEGELECRLGELLLWKVVALESLPIENLQVVSASIR